MKLYSPKGSRGEWRECQGPKVDRKLRNKKTNRGDQRCRTKLRLAVSG